VARPKTQDVEVRRSVAQELAQYFLREQVSKTELCARIGITRQMLHKYLNSKATPSLETLAKIARLPGFALAPWGKTIPADELRSDEPRFPEAEQAMLPFDKPVSLESDDRALVIDVKREASGLLELNVRLRVAK
jgi:transcriptional regulator with XRE-family HTH domain